MPELLKVKAPSPLSKTDGSGPPPMPASWTGSDLEWIVYWWLTKEKIPFVYQSPFGGGRKQIGGQVVDFEVTDRVPSLLIGVQGEYFHYRTGGQRARSLMSKVVLQARGYMVVYVLGRDLQTRPDYTMRAALRGEQLFGD